MIYFRAKKRKRRSTKEVLREHRVLGREEKSYAVLQAERTATRPQERAVAAARDRHPFASLTADPGGPT